MERCGEVGKRFKAALVFGLGDELDVDRNFHRSWYKAKSANTYFETHIPRCENLKSFSALQDLFFSGRQMQKLLHWKPVHQGDNPKGEREMT